MTQWLEALSGLQQVYAFIALPATLILVIQSVMVLFGLGHDGADMDHGDMGHGGMDLGHAHADHDHGASDGFALFSIRGLLAFLSVGGWTGIVLDGAGASAAVTILVSLVAGLAAMYLVALLFRMAAKLQSSGNLDFNNAVGKSAKVYIPIPANEAGTGKVTLTLQERFVECDALTRSTRGLKTGEFVRITGIVGENTLIVEPESAAAAQTPLEQMYIDQIKLEV